MEQMGRAGEKVETETIPAGSALMTVAPSEDFMPLHTRKVLAKVLRESVGWDNPSVLLVIAP